MGDTTRQTKKTIRQGIYKALFAVLASSLVGMSLDDSANATVICAPGGGHAPLGWTLDGVGGGINASTAPFTPPGVSPSGSTVCTIVTDTGPGVGTVPTSYSPANLNIAGTTNGSQMTSPVFTSKPGDQLHFQFMFFTNDGTGTFSDVARAGLINPSSHADVLNLFTARTGTNSQVVPGYGFSNLPAGLVLTPPTGTLQGNSFTLGDFGTNNGATTYGPDRFGGGPGGSSPWVDATYTFDNSTAGTYQLQMAVANVGDQIYSTGLAFTGSSPSSAPPPPPVLSPTQFAFPLTSTVPVNLVTEAGGISADNSLPPGNTKGTFCGVTVGKAYFDPCHEPNKANYALDLTSSNASVVAAKGGTIVQLYGHNDLNPNNSPSGIQQKCDIKNCVVIQSANGLYEEYREFTSLAKNPDGSNFHVGEHIAAGAKLGTVQGNHLHFQVETVVNGKLNSKSCTYVPDNCNPILSKVTVGGRLFKDYKLADNNNTPITGNSVKYNADGSIDISSLSALNNDPPTETKIYGQNLPLVTTTSNPNSKAYNFNVVVGDLGVGNTSTLPIFIDPAIAIGYDYSVSSGPNFASVILPKIGSSLYDLYLLDPILNQWIFNTTLGPDVTHLFGPGGVSQFRILGIDPAAALDPNNPTAFVTGLSFAGSGPVDFSMTPISQDVSVDDPPTLLLFTPCLIGLLLFRERTNIAEQTKQPEGWSAHAT